MSVIDKLLAALNDHSARIVAAVSSTQREADELYLPHFAPASPISDQTSVQASHFSSSLAAGADPPPCSLPDNRSLASALLEYLDLSRFVDDFAFGPLRGDVRRAYYGGFGQWPRISICWQAAVD